MTTPERRTGPTSEQAREQDRELLRRYHDDGTVDLLQVADLVGEAAEDLRRDHTRVPARAHQRAAADGLAHLHHRLRGVELGADRLERQRHVRSGVTVRDRVHVEPVERLRVLTQRVAERQDHPPQGVDIQLLAYRHDRPLYRRVCASRRLGKGPFSRRSAPGR